MKKKQTAPALILIVFFVIVGALLKGFAKWLIGYSSVNVAAMIIGLLLLAGVAFFILLLSSISISQKANLKNKVLEDLLKAQGITVESISFSKSDGTGDVMVTMTDEDGKVVKYDGKNTFEKI